MPLPMPNLDDRTFADLVAEGRAMIPRLAPEWTNYNPSDPGITLLELLAWLTESFLYDVNQVRDDSTRAFLSLIDAAPLPGESLESATLRAFSALRRRSRAVHTADFEALAASVPATAVERARAIPDLNLEGTTVSGEAHVSLVVLPTREALGLPADLGARTCGVLQTAMAGPAMDFLRAGVATSLEPHLLVTTVLHVIPPGFVSVAARIRLVGRPDAKLVEVSRDAEAAFRRFLDPYEGGNPAAGDPGAGWPFGRAVYKSELWQLLEAVPGVDHVAELTLNDAAGDAPVVLAPHQLVCVGNVQVAVDLEDPS